MRMSSNDLAAILAKNKHVTVSGEAPRAKPKPTVQHAPVGKAQREVSNPVRVSVCVTSFRRRLIDPDNLCPKFFIDCLRYAGLIKNDRAQDIALTVEQKQVQSRTDERTEITIGEMT